MKFMFYVISSISKNKMNFTKKSTVDTASKLPSSNKEAVHEPNDDVKKEQEAAKSTEPKKEPTVPEDELDQITEEMIFDMAEDEIEKSLGPFT